MRKIIFIISSLGSGGAERVVVNLSNYFSKKHEVSIVTLSNEESFYNLNANVKHIKLNLTEKSNNILGSIKNNLNRILEIRKIVKKENPDIMVSFLTQTNIISLISSSGIKFKKILSERSVYFSENSNFIWKFLRRLTYPFANNVILLTKGDAENYKFLKNKAIIPNFVNNTENNHSLCKENIILAVGRLHPVKQFDKLIELYYKSKIEWPLYIVGDGQEMDKLKKMIKEFNLEKKIFLEGRKTNIYDYYKKAKIFALTSKHEAFPNAMLEAIYFGCGVVGFDCPYGPKEIIENGKSGYLVKDDNDFIEKLHLLVNNEAILNKISQNAKNRAKVFNKNKILKKWEKYVEN